MKKQVKIKIRIESNVEIGRSVSVYYLLGLGYSFNENFM